MQINIMNKLLQQVFWHKMQEKLVDTIIARLIRKLFEQYFDYLTHLVCLNNRTLYIFAMDNPVYYVKSLTEDNEGDSPCTRLRLFVVENEGST